MTLDVSVKIPVKEYQDLFDQAPDVAFYHLRDTMGAVFGSFRRTHLSRTQVRNARRLTFYRISPLGNQGKKRKPGQDLSAIVGESLTSSKAALGLEVGGTIRPKKGKFLAIPMDTVRTKSGRARKGSHSPKRYARGKKPGSLVVLPENAGQFPPNPRADGLVLFHRRGSGKKRRLIPVFRLVREVRIKPRFKFMDTWDSLKADRVARFRKGLDRIVSDMAKGKTP